MNVIDKDQTIKAIQFTGDNYADIDAQLNSASVAVTAKDGSPLLLVRAWSIESIVRESRAPVHVVFRGDWIVGRGEFDSKIFTDEQFKAKYSEYEVRV